MGPSTATLLMMMFSVLVPQKMWFNPQQPLTVSVKSDKDVTLELTDFTGKLLDAKGSADVVASKDFDIKQIFPQTATPGTYVLYALAKGTTPSKSGPPADFLGTPMVIEVIPAQNLTRDADGMDQVITNPQVPMVTHIVPLQYVVMTTQAGSMTQAFYYDSAPYTIGSYLRLCAGGYYDGTVFHRVVPHFVIQGGDPLGTDPDPKNHGLGGPGFTLPPEFNDRPHGEGALSMARAGLTESAGSQFFICLDLDDQHKQALDHKYTAFGKVTDGMDTVKAIGTAPVNDETPEKPVMITKAEVLPVTAKNNPYKSLMTPQ